MARTLFTTIKRERQFNRIARKSAPIRSYADQCAARSQRAFSSAYQMEICLRGLHDSPMMIQSLRKELKKWKALHLKTIRQVKGAFFKKNAVPEIKTAMREIAEGKKASLREMVVAIDDVQMNSQVPFALRNFIPHMLAEASIVEVEWEIIIEEFKDPEVQVE